MFEPFEERREKVTDAFDLFVEEFIIKGNSILTKEDKPDGFDLASAIEAFKNEILPKYDKAYTKALEELKRRFDKHEKEGGKGDKPKIDFDLTIDQLIEDTKEKSPNLRLFYAHLEWLYIISKSESTTTSKFDHIYKLLNYELDNKTKRNKAFELKKAGFKPSLYPEGIASHGPWHKTNHVYEIIYLFALIELLIGLKKKNIQKDRLKEYAEVVSEFILYHDKRNIEALESFLNKRSAEIKSEQKKKNSTSSVEKHEEPINKIEHKDLFTTFFKYWDEKTYSGITEKLKHSISMCNVIMYLGNHNRHEPIVSKGHKENIAKAFSFLLEGSELNTESELYKIRNIIEDKYNFDTFYDRDEMKLLPLWNPGSYDKSFEAYEALMYKKAIVLYGPPGTSKTYSANQIAETVCLFHKFNSFVSDYAKKEWLIEDHLCSKNEKTDEEQKENRNGKTDEEPQQITNLQLHANYTYQDFIGGLQIKKDETKAVKGDFYTIIDEAKENKDKPYVLILDEINRTDLSAMFGEVFSALENRNKEVTVSVPFDDEGSDADLKKLKVPENLYIIGTMNEIDFSLEKLDFAMRRRFLWFFHGYEEQRLRDILNFKLKKDWFKEKEDSDENEPKIISIYEHGDELSIFLDRATKLNKAIEDEPLLGPDYVIGHTFFAEILDIQNQYKDSTSSNQKYKFDKDGGPVDILWNISIKPMIEAFLGALDPETKKVKVEELYKTYKPRSQKD